MTPDLGEAQLRSALAALDEDDETTVDTGLSYRADEPVLVRVRRRGHRYDISDDGTAVALAGKPDDWLRKTERLVAVECFNANRPGVIFVPAVEPRYRLVDSPARQYVPNRVPHLGRRGGGYVTLVGADGEPADLSLLHLTNVLSTPVRLRAPATRPMITLVPQGARSSGAFLDCPHGMAG